MTAGDGPDPRLVGAGFTLATALFAAALWFSPSLVAMVATLG